MSIIQSDQHFIVLSQSAFSSKSFSENMAAPMKKYFNFHFPSDSRQFESLDDKNVCVISVIGKSQYSGKKFSIFSKVLDRDVVLNSSDRQEVCGVKCLINQGRSKRVKYFTPWFDIHVRIFIYIIMIIIIMFL